METAEKTEVSGKQPWEARFESEHPELFPGSKKEETKEVAKEVEKPVEKAEPEEAADDNKEKIEIGEQPVEKESAPVEKQPEEKEAAPEETKENKKEPPAIDDERVRVYALKKEITTDEAREQLEKLRAIRVKYQDDPDELAEAYRNQQAEYDKMKTQHERAAASQRAAMVMANPKEYVVREITKQKDVLIDEFRKENPARSRDMDDEQIVEELTNRTVEIVKSNIQEHQGRMQKDAASKRQELIGSLTADEKSLLPDIKAVINKLPDAQVLGADFKFQDLKDWAYGKNAKRLIKEAEERGYQRALQNKQIVGERGISKEVAATKKVIKSEVVAGEGLTNYEKNKAREMFQALPDDEAFKAYVEVTKGRKK